MDDKLIEQEQSERRANIKELNKNIKDLSDNIYQQTVVLAELKKDHEQNKIAICKIENTVYGKDDNGGLRSDVEVMKITVSNVKWLLNFLGVSFIASSLILIGKWIIGK